MLKWAYPPLIVQKIIFNFQDFMTFGTKKTLKGGWCKRKTTQLPDY